MRYKTTPRAHQQQALDRMKGRPGFSLMMGVGTGKSWCVLNDAALQCETPLLIIVAPNGVHEDTWPTEIAKHWPGAPPLVGVTRAGRRDHGLQTLLAQPTHPMRIACVHYESFYSDTGADVVATLARQARGSAYLVLDESHRIKTPSAKLTRKLWNLSRLCGWRRILSGTMTTKGYEDLYAQYRFLSPDIIGCTTYAAFKAMFLVQVPVYDENGRVRYTMPKGYQNLPYLFQRIAPVTFQVHKKDCLDLPPQTWVDRPVVLSGAQRQLYNALIEDNVALLDSGQVVLADQIIVRLMRLQQIVAGHVGTGPNQWEPVACPRLEDCADTVAQSDGKTLVWARFVPDRIQLLKLFREQGIGALEYTTDTAADVLHRFRTDPGIQALILNPASAGAGLTLNEAPNAVHYSLSFRWDHLAQSEGRNHRDGQTVPVTYTTLVARGTTDDHVRRVLRAGADVAATLQTTPELQGWLRTPVP